MRRQPILSQIVRGNMLGNEISEFFSEGLYFCSKLTIKPPSLFPTLGKAQITSTYSSHLRNFLVAIFAFIWKIGNSWKYF